ncbi:hypothetical protein BJ165DRAFT_399714 [Panaeolus papilionaceus]|nr:hypothetical protein BJ165DRAFT_399714 [Panaeolus papilionaceus]
MKLFVLFICICVLPSPRASHPFPFSLSLSVRIQLVLTYPFRSLFLSLLSAVPAVFPHRRARSPSTKEVYSFLFSIINTIILNIS